MKEKFILTEFNIADVLDEVRKPNGNKKSNTKTFEDIVPDVWKKFGLEGNPNPVTLENLLINLILDLYDIKKAENIEEKRGIAQNRDVCLLMFGLLDGYYHTEEKNGKKANVSSEERYERYLNDSDFIKLDYPGEGTYQEIKIKDKERKTKSKSAQSRPLNKLTKIAGDCKKEIGINLFELIKTKSNKQYIDELQGADNANTSIDLPKPYYTLENFSSISEPEPDQTDNPEGEDNIAQEESGQDIADGQAEFISGGQDMPGGRGPFTVIWEKIGAHIGCLKKRFKTMDVIVILLLLFIAAATWKTAQSLKNNEKTWQSAGTANNATTENDALSITDITIHNAKITLTPDKPWEKLRVSIYPREANIDDVNYTSDNPRLVTVSKEAERVELAPEWRNETERATKIRVQSGTVEDRVPVNVQEYPIADSTAAPSESRLDSNDPDNSGCVSGF